ncbi:MAG: hypothetical protein ABIW84_08640 [Ilumatobacteraceae bacterium]
MKLLSSQLADTVNDADSTRKVYMLAGALVLLGILLITVTVWFWRSTHHDPELLAPLEAMDSRGFRKADGGAQQHLLDEARPDSAQPMRWGVVRGEPDSGHEVDLRAINKAPARSDYDDLRESNDVPADVAAAPDPVVAVDRAADEPLPSTSVEVDPVDATAETVVGEFAILDAMRVPAKSAGGRDGPPEKVDLLIVPVDHELARDHGRDAARAQSTVGRTSDADRVAASAHARDQVDADDIDEIDDIDGDSDDGDSDEESTSPADGARASIDPLLRKFERTDG